MDTELLRDLSEIGDLGQGTLVSLVLRKKGCERQGQTYGNDLTQVLLWTGFHYKALVERSQAKLTALWTGTFLTDTFKTLQAAGHTNVTLADVSVAAQELQGNFHRVLSGKDPMAGSGVEGVTLPSTELTTAKERDWTLLGTCGSDIQEIISTPVFEPLKVEGKNILGAKVYIGNGSKDPQAAVPGTVYIDGVKIGERVLEASPVWVPKQLGKTIAKDYIRSLLPVGLYVRYSLAKENLKTCKVGKEASLHAKEGGVTIDPEAIRSLFHI